MKTKQKQPLSKKLVHAKLSVKTTPKAAEEKQAAESVKKRKPPKDLNSYAEPKRDSIGRLIKTPIEVEPTAELKDVYGKEVKHDNVVEIPQKLLEAVLGNIDKRGDGYARRMLNSVAGNLLGFSSAGNYIKAALNVLGIDIELDDALPKALKNVGRLEIISLSLKDSHIPRRTKETLLEALALEMGKSIMATFESTDKSAVKSRQIQEMQAVVRKTSDQRTKPDSKLPESMQRELREASLEIASGIANKDHGVGVMKRGR